MSGHLHDFNCPETVEHAARHAAPTPESDVLTVCDGYVGQHAEAAA